MPRDLTALFFPESVAVIGASRSSEKVGAIVLKNIIASGFRGRIFPVNPNAENLNQLKCYPDLASLPQVPDLAVVALPAEHVSEVLNDIGKFGIKNVVIFAAGFKEIGPAGETLEKELTDIATRFELNLLGPNCLGFVNNLHPINVTFGQVVNRPGNLRFISQSGALAASIFDWCESSELGFSYFVTLGNKAVLNENDILNFWLNHPTTPIASQKGLSQVSPIGLYLESIANGQEFYPLVKQISQKDPIFVLKPGKSPEAARAMQSHTGAIAGEDQVLGQALTQAGVIRCQELEDFFDLAKALSWENAPPGPQVAIITNAGGPAVLSTDTASLSGLKLVQFSDNTQRLLAENLPRTASFLNPVDVLGDALADRFAKAIEIVLQEKDTQSLIVLLTPQLMTQIEKTAKVISDLSQKFTKPVLCSFIGGSSVAKGEALLNRYQIPSFTFPERAVKALAAMWHWQDWRSESIETPTQVSPRLDIAKKLLDQAKSNQPHTLDTLILNDILTSVDITTPATQEITEPIQAQNFARDFGYPVVLKFTSPQILHKTDAGSVITSLAHGEQLAAAFSQFRLRQENLNSSIRPDSKIIIQKQITGGVEVIVGVKRDPNFGPILLFGAGGTLAELLADRNLYLLPINPSAARRLIETSKVFPLLSGYRGAPPCHINSLVNLIVRLGELATIQDIAEIEINPAIVTSSGTFAVDARVILGYPLPNNVK